MVREQAEAEAEANPVKEELEQDIDLTSLDDEELDDDDQIAEGTVMLSEDGSVSIVKEEGATATQVLQQVSLSMLSSVAASGRDQHVHFVCRGWDIRTSRGIQDHWADTGQDTTLLSWLSSCEVQGTCLMATVALTAYHSMMLLLRCTPTIAAAEHSNFVSSERGVFQFEKNANGTEG